MTSPANNDVSTEAAAPWVQNHWKVWDRKALLRSYYEEEYFRRIVAAMPPGKSLEIGAGPGFFSRYHRCDIVSDVTPAPHVDQVVDVHAIPFPDQTFDAVVGVDVIHHFYHPAKGLSEIARVLRPGGRLVLVEPWTGPAGIFVNKYLHTEDCFPLDDPWAPVFTGGKNPMDGNATIPKTLFDDYAEDLPKHTGLKAVTVEPFSCMGFLATGGFTRWQLPMAVGRGLMEVERRIPVPVWRVFGIKVFIVAERASA